MPDAYRKIILEIDPSADVELVGDIADEDFRYFSKMTRADWAACVEAAK